MTVTSIIAGDNKNKWLDQVEEEFGSDLSDNEEDMIGNSGTTIELGMDANASLAKEMKGKDYDLEGVDSRSSKRTHRTNMTGKTSMMSTQSVTTKKFAMNFSQNKKDLNAERRPHFWSNASRRWNRLWLLGLSTLEARRIGLHQMTASWSSMMYPTRPLIVRCPQMQNRNLSIYLPPLTHCDLAQIFASQLNLPPTPGNKSAKESSITEDEVGRWH
jgi:hypothetical protein